MKLLMAVLMLAVSLATVMFAEVPSAKAVTEMPSNPELAEVIVLVWLMS